MKLSQSFCDEPLIIHYEPDRYLVQAFGAWPARRGAPEYAGANRREHRGREGGAPQASEIVRAQAAGARRQAGLQKAWLVRVIRTPIERRLSGTISAVIGVIAGAPSRGPGGAGALFGGGAS